MTFGQQNSEREAHEQLSYALDEGINFVDTAELYPISPTRESQGASSSFVGSWLQTRRREDVVVASKVTGRSSNYPWIVAHRSHPAGEDAPTRVTGAAIRAAADAELRRLRTDYIDLFQIHWPDRYCCVFGNNQYDVEAEVDSTPVEEQVLAMQRLISEGKVRAWGVSNESTFGLTRFCAVADALGAPRPASVQNCFNLIHRVPETELAEACSPAHLNVGLLAWGPLCGGALTAKYVLGQDTGASRFTLWPERYPRYNTPAVHRAVEKYCKIAWEVGCTPAQLAIAFCRARWFTTSAIVGATTAGQLEENLDAAALRLSESVLAAIDQVHRSHRNPVLRN